MKKEVLVFISDGYADWESAYICSQLNAPETEYIVKTISLDKEPKTSMSGFRVIPDYSVTDYPERFSMLLLIGGIAWMEQKNREILPVVEHAVKKDIPIGAICDAVSFLAENGYLDKIRHTGNTAEYLKLLAPHYKGEGNFVQKQAVCHGGIITANGTASLEFAKEILFMLKIKPQVEIIRWYNEHRSGFYPV